MSAFARLGCLILSVAILATVAGCSSCSWGKHNLWPWSDDEPQVPSKIVAIWTNTVLYRPGLPAQRGFGGRLMFYATKEKKPVKVEGELVVYAFDETHRKKDDPKPDKKYVFRPEQLPRHYSKSEIGHSYSVWLPWDDNTAGPTCKISMIVRFLPHGGPLVVGEQTMQLLPGVAEECPAVLSGPAGATAAPGTIRPVSHEEPVPATGDPGAVANPPSPGFMVPRVRTTTIEVPVQSRLFSGGSPMMPTPTMNPAAGMAAHNAAMLNGRSESTAAAAPGWNPAVDPAKPESGFAWSPSIPPSTRFGQPKFRAPGEPLVPPRGDHVPTPPHPAEWPSVPQPSTAGAPGS
jgi:hypothetical protein